jgi:hypothetical protein
MYPGAELAELAVRKERVLRRIELRRTETILIGEIISARVSVFEEWRERITRWSGVASAAFPFFLGVRTQLKRPFPKGKWGRIFRFLRIGLKIMRGLRPLTYAFRAG